MFPFEYLLAVALLTAPADGPQPEINPDLCPSLRSALQQLAIQWETLDPREARYVLARSEDFESDLNLLRRRYEEFADVPPLSDCGRLPDLAVIDDLLAFNRAYRQHLEGRRTIDLVHREGLREAVQETDRLYQVWGTIRDARFDHYYVTVRRQALKRLRATLGPEAYYAGCFPPHVPVWIFQRID
jgi:hypothetical protein